MTDMIPDAPSDKNRHTVTGVLLLISLAWFVIGLGLKLFGLLPIIPVAWIIGPMLYIWGGAIITAWITATIKAAVMQGILSAASISNAVNAAEEAKKKLN